MYISGSPDQGGTTHSKLGPPTEIIHPENGPLTGQPDGGIFSSVILSAQMTLACFSLAENQPV